MLFFLRTSSSPKFAIQSLSSIFSSSFSTKVTQRLPAITLHDVTKRVGQSRCLFEDINLTFYRGAKIGILGANGSGKSSLMKIMAQQDTNFDGKVRIEKDLKIGFLHQEPELDESLTVEENVMMGVKYWQDALDAYEKVNAKFSDPDITNFDDLIAQQSKLLDIIESGDAWNLQHKIDTAISALNCPPGSSSVHNLSGGEKRRVALCRLLLAQPNILLLDEPTNHLDADSVAWLEQYLESYKGLIVAITHDRYFLDNVASYILELDQGKCYAYKGNYQKWLENKVIRQEFKSAKEKGQEKIYLRELEWMRKNAKGSVKKGKKRAVKFEQLEKERSEQKNNQREESGSLIIPAGPRLGEQVLEFKKVSLRFGNNHLFNKLSFKLNKGQILGIVGPNGSGKTSLFKLVTGQKIPDEGEIIIGDTVVFGYNTQTRENLNDNNPIWREICGNDTKLEVRGGKTMAARAYVAQFNFSGDVQQKRISQLSGGERNRVMLAKSLKVGCNVLLLDEPTNDLDVNTLCKLEEALLERKNYAATILISHDRWFLSRLCTHVMAFEKGSMMYFSGGFKEYQKDRQLRSRNKKSLKQISRKLFS